MHIDLRLKLEFVQMIFLQKEYLDRSILTIFRREEKVVIYLAII